MGILLEHFGACSCGDGHCLADVAFSSCKFESFESQVNNSQKKSLELNFAYPVQPRMWALRRAFLSILKGAPPVEIERGAHTPRRLRSGMPDTKTINHRELLRQAKKDARSGVSQARCVADPKQPRQRGGCQDIERPCPYVSCRYHLYLDAKASGAIKIQKQAVEDMDESCALDVAAQGPQTLESVATLMGVTRQRIDQEQELALKKMRSERADLASIAYEPIAQTDYVGAPADDDMTTLKQERAPTWIKNLWHAALMHAEAP